MNLKRLWLTIRLWTIPEAEMRAEYLKKKHIFAAFGDSCSWMQRTVPIYPGLVKIGNNVHTATNVSLVPHDVTHNVVNGYLESNGTDRKVIEKVGCIEIGDNVFIGAGSRILYDVRIGNNVIIGANSLVTKDIPSNSVVGGVPARYISSFEDFVCKRLMEEIPPNYEKEGLNKEVQSWLWKSFYKKREKE